MSRNSIISLLLMLIFTITTFINIAFASNNSNANVNNTISSGLSEKSIPETISYENVIQQGHTERLYSAEKDLNTAVFKNRNGSNTMYIFNENIKYVDSKGNIQDKSNKLTFEKNGYKNTQNDINVFYPSEISSGITLSFDDHSISFKPLIDSKETFTATHKTNERHDIADQIEYYDVFGKGSKLVYTQELNGVKEEIILYKPIDTTKFSFEVSTSDLKLLQNNDTINIVDVNSKEAVAKMTPLILIDSNGVYGVGHYSIGLSSQKNTYILTIDATEFLNNTNLVYPVIIDPSMTVEQGNSAAIEDMTIFTNYSTNFGSWYSLFVGNYDAWYPNSPSPRGTARTLLKFPGLMNNSTFQSYYEDDLVHSVKYNFADIDCGSGPIIINAYRMLRTWNESTDVYSDILWNGYDLTLIGSTTISPSSPIPSPFPRYEIDITDAVDKWQSGTSNFGIMLKASNENAKAAVLGASESGSSGGISSSKPYIVVNYGSYRAYVNNYYDDGYLIYHSLNANQTQTYIKNIYKDISEFYLNNLGLNLKFDSSNEKKALSYDSAIDRCKGTVTGTNINTLCTHTDPCTDRSTVLQNFNPSGGNNLTTNAYWTGHRIKSEVKTKNDNGEDVTIIYYNRSCSQGNRIFMLTRDTSEQATVLLHELNHQYGGNDHYHEMVLKEGTKVCKNKERCSICNRNNGRSTSCIMYTTNVDLSDSDVFCDPCKEEILAHLDHHH